MIHRVPQETPENERHQHADNGGSQQNQGRFDRQGGAHPVGVHPRAGGARRCGAATHQERRAPGSVPPRWFVEHRARFRRAGYPGLARGRDEGHPRFGTARPPGGPSRGVRGNRRLRPGRANRKGNGARRLVAHPHHRPGGRGSLHRRPWDVPHEPRPGVRHRESGAQRRAGGDRHGGRRGRVQSRGAPQPSETSAAAASHDAPPRRCGVRSGRRLATHWTHTGR